MAVSREAVKLYENRIEANGSYTMLEHSVKGTVEESCAQEDVKADKSNTRMGMLFSPSFTDEEKDSLLGEMKQRGFTQIREYTLSSYICDYIKGHPYVLILQSEKGNLYVEYDDTHKKQVIAKTVIEGAGKDPRIEVLSEVIWKKLVSESSYLNKEEAMGKIKEIAKAFLASGKSELDGNIFLEGENHDFFVRRKDASIDDLQEHGSSSVLDSLNDFANQASINRAETIMVMTGSLTTNAYFHDLLQGFVADMKDIDKEWEQTILSSIMNDLMAPCNNEDNRNNAGNRCTDGHPIGINRQVGIDGLPLQVLDPIQLSVEENKEEAVLSWENPANGDVRVYLSTRPFPQHENDVIPEANSLEYTELTTLGNRYRLKKDFCGERFFLPVTIVDNTGVAGKQLVISSIVAPKGIRVDSTDSNHVKVVWIWDDVPSVRVKWKDEDGNEQWKDIANDGQEPEFEVPLPNKSRNFTVTVSALYQRKDGTLLESEETILKVALSAIKVNFVSAKSEAKFFLHKDEYTLTLQAEREPPCDLYVLLAEGRIPLDLTNFKSYLTIHHEDLVDGQEKKYPLSYHRQQKGQPLFFRIIAADRNAPVKVVPETQKIK